MNTPIAYQPTAADLVAPEIYCTPIAGLFFSPRTAHNDNRGFYAELARIPEFEQATGEHFVVAQMNLSLSLTHVVRGFHTENWDKLLTIIEGTSFCAWADIRPESPTFGQVVTMEMGNNTEIGFGTVFVSKGIANSFCVTKGPLYYLYAVNQLYRNRDTNGDTAISLFDPDLNVNWPIPQTEMVISERDLQAQSLRERFPEKFA